MNAPSGLTRNQALVLAALERAEGPLSAYTILDTLRDEGFRAPLQVYRALEKLLERGLIHRLESLNAFVACAHGHDHEHDEGVAAFAICKDCGHVTEFSDPQIGAGLSEWARATGFRASKTTVELRGRCKSCTER